MSDANVKVCKVCGCDCSTKPRVKNSIGDYFCEACVPPSMVASAAHLAPVETPPAPIAITSQDAPWFDAYVVPALRHTSNLSVLQGTTALGILWVVFHAICAVGTVLIFVSDGVGKIGIALAWHAALLVISFFAMTNALYCNSRLRIPKIAHARAIGGTTSSDAPTSEVRQPVVRADMPWAKLTWIGLPTVLATILLVASFVYYQSQMHPQLPHIKVTGNAASQVVFSDWRMDTRALRGVLRYKGQLFVEVRYTVGEVTSPQKTQIVFP